MTDPPTAAQSRAGRRLRLRSLLARLFLITGLIVTGVSVAGAVAFVHLVNERNRLITRTDPAEILLGQLLSSYLDEETGLRGYALSGQTSFLDPYRRAAAEVPVDDRQLGVLLPPGTPAGRLLDAVESSAEAWSSQFAQPAVAAIAAGDRSYLSVATLSAGKALFDRFRAQVSALQGELDRQRAAAESRLRTYSDELTTVMIAGLAVIAVTAALIWAALRRLVVGPLSEVASDSRMIAAGQLDHHVRPTGPLEVAELATDIEMMRQRLLWEVSAAQEAQSQLAAVNAELARSNEDLEQFAYVASHDLQEPLRKVASFCQLLEQRYGDQLDERGHQYIAFAVDGAKRMQVLISDLLAFSRIGRTTDQFVDVDLNGCFEAALSDLAQVVEKESARVSTAGELPVVSGDRTLLTLLLQNLIGNAVKFRGEENPVVVVAAEPAEQSMWLCSVTDNGIGIEPRFADRIFVIFQRLHGRESYPGTGIGLAMCRKIVEFHGGRIWLDTEYRDGTRFFFTLPMTTAHAAVEEGGASDEEPNDDVSSPVHHSG